MATDHTLNGAPALSAPEQQLVEAIRVGLSGDAGRMQQLLRRSLRRGPSPLGPEKAALRDALLLAAAQSAPPTPGGPNPANQARDSDVWKGPEQIPGLRFAQPAPHRAERLRPSLRDRRASSSLQTLAKISDGAADSPQALRLDSTPAAEPHLPPHIALTVDELVLEYTSDLLASRGLAPTRTVLMTGDPGTGKTMTARWIAAKMRRPLLILDLADVMSKDLGASAHNLAEAFDTAAATEGVLFIDEFDAVSSARSDTRDVGEMRRLVNVLLMRLDRWPAGHLLLAATNHPELLDRAVGRRFEQRLEFPPPDAHARSAILRTVVPELDDRDALALAEVTDGISGSDLRSAAMRAARRAALGGTSVGLSNVLSELGLQPGRMSRSERDTLISILSRKGLSSRRIGELVGVSHVTVADVLKGTAAGAGDAKPRASRRTAKASGTITR